MPPSPEERLAKLEAETMHMKELLVEVRTELRRLPKRISSNTKQQLERCRIIQNGQYAQIFSDSGPAKKPRPGAEEIATDWSALKKTLVGLLMLGALIGGAVYQFRESSRQIKATQSQGAQP